MQRLQHALRLLRRAYTNDNEDLRIWIRTIGSLEKTVKKLPSQKSSLKGPLQELLRTQPQLANSASFLKFVSKKQSSLHGYAGHCRRFLSYALHHRGRLHGRDLRIEDVSAFFWHKVTQDSLNPASLKPIRAGIAFFLKDHAFWNDEWLDSHTKVLRGIYGKPTKKKRPITKDMLRRMWNQVDIHDFYQFRNFLLIYIMFLACLRQSEASALTWDDLAVDIIDFHGVPTEVISIALRETKTQLPDEGHLVFLAASPGIPLDPVRLLRQYLSHIPEDGIFVFPTRNGTRMKYKTVNNIFKNAVRNIGLDPKDFATHSSRIGGVTEAFKLGISPAVLKAHGRWKSCVVFGYFNDPMYCHLLVSRALAA